jgi:hypothetical protein
MARAMILWLTGIAAFALFLELLFRVLPVSTATAADYYTDPMILTYPAHHQWIASTGWDLRNAQTLQANNLGYVADRDFVRNPRAVALIGDSFIEASMLDAVDRPGAQLERALASRPVYAMGNPGTALLDYAERIRFASEQLGVRDFVVLMERGDVRQSLCGSGNINGPCLDSKTFEPRIETRPPAGIAKQIFRHSALAQYVFGQLKFNPAKFWNLALPPMKHDERPVAQPRLATPATTDIDAVTHTFFSRINPYVHGRLTIVVDSDRGALERGASTSDPARSRFMALARAAGAVVIDTEPLFREHLRQSRLKLDVGPYDKHLNPLGIQLITTAVAAAINGP